jgi:hypothetical protein
MTVSDVSHVSKNAPSSNAAPVSAACDEVCDDISVSAYSTEGSQPRNTSSPNEKSINSTLGQVRSSAAESYSSAESLSAESEQLLQQTKALPKEGEVADANLYSSTDYCGSEYSIVSTEQSDGSQASKKSCEASVAQRHSTSRSELGLSALDSSESEDSFRGCATPTVRTYLH